MLRFRVLLVTVFAAAALTACSSIETPLQAASGMTSQLICSETFISRLPPEKAFAEMVESIPGLRTISWAMSYDVDKANRLVTTTVAGGFESKAVFRDHAGCLIYRDEAPAMEGDAGDSATPAEVAGTEVVEPTDPRLRAALARAFAEPEEPPFRRTRAVVVLRDGKIIAERYAPGFGPDTPLKSWSVAKSLTNALIGVLVRQGRLSVDDTALLPAWQGPNDPRRAVTIDTLLRHTSGLALAQTNSGSDPSTRMKFVERDMAGYAQGAELEVSPGSRWAYTDGNYMLLSRVIRDAVGGRGEDVRQFAQRELFDPLGMRHVTMEFDATGTPLGSHSIYASARDWARLGQLYLDDGIAAGRRILPEGWVRYSSSQTLNTGYGAGFYINLVSGNVPEWGVPWGFSRAPRDAFFARGYMGQFVVIVPSERLVVVRFAASQIKGDDIGSADELVGDVIAALRPAAADR